MKTELVVAGLCGVFALATGAWALSVNDDNAALEARITSLEAETQTATTRRSRKQERRRVHSEEGGEAPHERGDHGMHRDGEAELRMIEGAAISDDELDELVTERIHERRSERRAEHRAKLFDYVDGYAADAELADDAHAQLTSTVETSLEAMSELWTEHHSEMDRGDQDIDHESVREEMRAIRDELEADVNEVLGEEEGEAFVEEMPSWWGGRGRSH